MSSVASQRVLLTALGGVSIAALFLWYIQSQRSAKKVEQKKKVKELLNPDTSLTANRSDNEVIKKETLKSSTTENLSEEASTVDSSNLEKVTEQMAPSTEHSVLPRTQEPNSGTIHVETNFNASSEETTNVYMNNYAGDGSSVSEDEYDIKEEAKCQKTTELMLDCSHLPLEPESFLWAEEMERSYIEQTENEHNQNLYGDSGSPAGSQDSMGSSQDSGRATGGLASSLSPMDDCNDGFPMYEFEIPNSLVGLIIGVKGKTIKELSTRTEVKMLIRPHHAPEKSDTHQICQVRGKRDQINKCLQMLRRRFPPERFPELNLQPVLPPILPTSLFDALTGQPSWLSLPENVSCEVVCSSITDPGHFFVQQPTHPSFPSLAVLDRYMLILYTSGASIPELPKPCQNGLLCAAPVLGAWFRAVTVAYYEESDEVLVRFVDYGGYKTIPRGDLRQIRTDLMSLPFQATECHLAHVQPIDGTTQWPEESLDFFQKICMGKVVVATVVGTHVEDKMPMVEICITSEEDGTIIRLDEALMTAGFAKASDPSKMSRFSSVKHPLFVSQQSTVLVS